jgi:hypothetical protein
MPPDLYRIIQLQLAFANDFQLLVRTSKIIRKVPLMQLRLQSTPNNLMHNQSQHKSINSIKVNDCGVMHQGLP